jgi:hypothetical protein
MEYLRHHGSFDDVPLERLHADFAKAYPSMGGQSVALKNANFEVDVSRETRS